LDQAHNNILSSQRALSESRNIKHRSSKYAAL